jgi:hypothetical protein
LLQIKGDCQMIMAAWLLKEMIPSAPIQPSTLPLIVKVIGYVVSWATSIYFLWAKNPPKLLVDHHAFKQVRAISIISISIFLMLAFGYLGNSNGLPLLAKLAATLAITGIIIFFVVAAAISRLERNRSTSVSIFLLIGFLIYTFAISAGLTSAGVFLVVILTNTSNAQAGTALISPIRYNARIKVTGTADVGQDQDVPFSQSSGQVNVGCDETRPVQVIFNLPTGATFLDKPVANWRNTVNLSSETANSIVSGAQIVGQGQIRGMSSQQIAFFRNCPGGGHGELVLSGMYRSNLIHSESKELSLTSTLSSESKGIVWVTLPPPSVLQIKSIEAVLSFVEKQGEKIVLTVTPDSLHASSPDNRIAVSLDLANSRLGFQLQ